MRRLSSRSALASHLHTKHVSQQLTHRSRLVASSGELEAERDSRSDATDSRNADTLLRDSRSTTWVAGYVSAERRRPPGRESMGAPTLQTLSRPNLADALALLAGIVHAPRT